MELSNTLSAPPTNACTAARVRKLARRITQIYDDALAPHGLTIGQFGTLVSLRRSRSIGIARLAEVLSADASTLSRLLKPLAAAGFVSILPDLDDRRAKALRLTDAGAAKAHAAKAGWEAAQAQVAAQLGRDRLGALQFIVDDAFDRL
jgi:DNA-binding MarR family transcriptional regulator